MMLPVEVFSTKTVVFFACTAPPDVREQEKRLEAVLIEK